MSDAAHASPGPAPAPESSADLAARDRLLARIEREFATVTESLTVGGRSVAFTRVRDPEAVLDEVCRQEAAARRGVMPKRPLRMPYWAAVWESALALGEHLATRNLAGLHALDLGCGMGLAGLAMAAHGAAHITLGDIDTACLLFAQLNIWPWRDRCRVCRCDWQKDDLGQKFGLIVGSDVLYERAQWDHVEAFLVRHLADAGTVLIGEPGRPQAESFREWAVARGWQVGLTSARGGDRSIHVYELMR